MKLLALVWFSYVLSGCSRSEAPTPSASQPAANARPLPWYIRQYKGADKTNYWALESDMRNPNGGMYELTQFPDKEPTPEQKQQAAELIEKTLAAVKAKGWLDKEQALKDGYQKMYKDKIHYFKKEYLYDGELMNPEKPEFLMFYPTEHGELLMGVMFSALDHGPQIGGPLTLWHYHVEKGICYENDYLPIGQVNENGQCVTGVTRQKSPEMLHLWFFDHPDGRFATRMRLFEEHFALAQKQVLKMYNQ